MNVILKQDLVKRTSKFPKIRGFQNNTFYYQSIQDWNSLPTEIKRNENKQAFKSHVKKHLLVTQRVHQLLACDVTYHNAMENYYITFYFVYIFLLN